MRSGVCLIIIFICVAFGASIAQDRCREFITGMTLVAPPRPFDNDPMKDLVRINATWVAVIPYGFTPSGHAGLIFDSDRQWWGETTPGVEQTINYAKSNGLKVMLKPQVWLHGKWIGDLEFDSEEKWEKWESDYRNYIMHFAQLAEKHDVEMYCIGTELKKALIHRPSFWRQLIKDTRKLYSGKLTYCANWDDFQDVEFWDMLDYISISAYFPLSEDKEPRIKKLIQAWQPAKESLAAINRKYNKPIVFAEYGYLSTDGCAGKTWILEKSRQELEVNETAQANAIEALLEVFSKEDYWHGCFYWKWYALPGRKPGYINKDYSVQGKLGERKIKTLYHQLNNP